VHRFAAGALIGIVAAALVVASDRVLTAVAGEQNPFNILELKTYDMRMRRVARPASADKDIVLVDIDERSLRDLQPVAGRWPWPRLVHAELIDYLARGKPRVIAYDVGFPDPDTRSGFDYGGSSMSGAESDKAFADSIRSAGNVILLADASYDADVKDRQLPDAGYRLDVPGIIERLGVLPPASPIAKAASGFGHNLFILDPDGPLRHTVPFVRAQHRALPSLGVAAALRVAGIRPEEVTLDGTTIRYRDRSMPMTPRTVRTSDGAMRYLWGSINFRGPALLDDLKTRTYRTFSFFDLLYSQEQLLAGRAPDVDPSVFHDKIVFVGVSASGLFDVFETPFSNGRMPGVNVHASVADDILSNRFLAPPRTAATLVAALTCGLIIGVGAALMPAWWATGGTVAFLTLLGWIAGRLFATGRWVNLSQPALASSLALFGGVGYQYFVEGREKRKVKRLFGRYVSKDVYRQLMDDPSLAQLGGQRREMTVLFSDIRGFTTVTEQGAPEEIVRMLNEYFTRMVDIVFAHEGTIDKFVGDMVMALFGAPLDDEDHARHAVDAALAMIGALDVLNARWSSEGRPPLDIGIGINTGPMIAGNIGSEAIMSYTVIGDAVNLGSRLESLNKQFGTRIIISDATRERIGPSYVVRSLGDVVVKGKTKPVAIFEVTGRASEGTPAEAMSEART